MIKLEVKCDIQHFKKCIDKNSLKARLSNAKMSSPTYTIERVEPKTFSKQSIEWFSYPPVLHSWGVPQIQEQ